MYRRPMRVKETTTTTGTGTLQLAGAAADFESFIDRVGDQNQCSYYIFEPGTGAAERGIGTVSAGAPNTLSRDIVIESTNGDAQVNLAAGTKNVFIDADPSVLGSPFVDVIAKSANFTVTPHEAGMLIDVTTGGTDVTITLPPLAQVWRGFGVTVRKVDTGVGRVIVDGDGAEQIDGYATRKLWVVHDQVTVSKGAAGTSWACDARIADRVVVFTSSGTWTKEDGLLGIDEAEAQGGGGGGGGAGATTASEAAAGGGGSGGEYRSGRIAASALAASEIVTVGTGGIGGTGSGNGGNGGSTSFGAHLTAAGGGGGIGDSGGTATTGIGGGNPLSGAGGDIVVPGEPGHFGLRIPSIGFRGGGGGAVLGAGGRSSATGTTQNGSVGTGYGGGGSGAAQGSSQGSAAQGGAGAPGVCRLRERYST